MIKRMNILCLRLYEAIMKTDPFERLDGELLNFRLQKLPADKFILLDTCLWGLTMYLMMA